MGNYTSCCSIVKVIEPQRAKLIDFYGSFLHIKMPITAAELMLEHSGHFLSPADDLRRTLRYPAMKADDELLAGKVYMLVPKSRLNSKVSVTEMTVLESACQSRIKSVTTRAKARVLPEPTEVSCDQEGEGADGLVGRSDTGIPGCRLGINYQRQWRPALEPICEVISLEQFLIMD